MYTTFLIAATAAARGVLAYEADLKLGPQNCFDSFTHKDVRSATQGKFVDEACTLGGITGPDDKGIIAGGRAKRESWLDYHYVAIWIPGCTTTVDKQDTKQPIPGDDDVTCNTLLRNNYEACNNGGVGGWIDVGCLRFGFSIVDFPTEWSKKSLKDEEVKFDDAVF